jgi:D-amino-acid dehydrogenase
MLAGAVALQGLLRSSMALFEELVTAEPIDCDWEKRGLLFIYRDAEPFHAYDRTNKLLTQTFGEPAEKLSADAVLRLEPAVKEDIAGGWYYEHDAHLRSDRLLSSWRSLLLERGARISEHCEVTGIVRRAGRAVCAQTSLGDVEADHVVVATGALTPFLSRTLGCRIPIQPGKGYSLTMPRPQLCPRIPLMFPQRRVAVTPFKSGYRLGSIMEFAGYDTSIKPQRLQLLKDGAAEYLREPYTEPIEEEWFGWRPMTYDSLPIIDRSPMMSNVLIAAGHNMLGLSMSTGTGQLIAEMAAGGTPHLDVKPFAVTRF